MNTLKTVPANSSRSPHPIRTGLLGSALRHSLKSALESRKRLNKDEPLQNYAPKTARNHMVRFIEHAVSGASTFGGLTGTLGFLGAPLELPLFYIRACKHLVQTCLTFGFNPYDESEKDYILALLVIGHVPSFGQRKKMLEKLNSDPYTSAWALEAVGLYGLGRRFLVPAIARGLSPARIFNPVVGAALNASASARLMESILTTALIAYQERQVVAYTLVAQEAKD